MNEQTEKVWMTMREIQKNLASLPKNWLVRFAVKYPNDIRKLGDAKNSTLIYRVSAVLERIEDGSLARVQS